MATGEAPFEQLLRHLETDSERVEWTDSADLARMSLEALSGNADEHRGRSRGTVRLFGEAVDRNSAALEDVSAVLLNWQRAVTAVGASLEGVKTLRGRLSSTLLTRTAMELSGAGTGSLALSIAAKPDPEAEISPGGQDALVSPPRPLVDRASEALIGVMAQFATRDAVDDTLAATLTLHGSRFTSALRNLADAIARGGFDFQARWEEPYFPTQRVTWTTSTARDARGFIDGRDLDAEETELAGTLVTISNRERWLLDTADPDSDDGVTTVKLSATNITDEVARSLSVGDEVTVHAIVKTRMQPDGRTHSSYQALAVERRSEDRPAAE